VLLQHPHCHVPCSATPTSGDVLAGLLAGSTGKPLNVASEPHTEQILSCWPLCSLLEAKLPAKACRAPVPSALLAAAAAAGTGLLLLLLPLC